MRSDTLSVVAVTVYKAAPANNPATMIHYDMPAAAQVKLVVYDLQGREVKVLVDRYESAGYKAVEWDGRNNDGDMVSSGIYLYRVNTAQYTKTGKLTDDISY